MLFEDQFVRYIELIDTQPMTPIAHLHRAGSIGNPSSRNLYAMVRTTTDDGDVAEREQNGSVVDDLLAAELPAGDTVEMQSVDLTQDMSKSPTKSPKR